MYKNIIKIPFSQTKNEYHYFCNKCHFYFYQNIGNTFYPNFCPNCGISLYWCSGRSKDYFDEWIQFSQDLYKELNNKEAIGNV